MEPSETPQGCEIVYWYRPEICHLHVRLQNSIWFSTSGYCHGIKDHQYNASMGNFPLSLQMVACQTAQSRGNSYENISVENGQVDVFKSFVAYSGHKHSVLFLPLLLVCPSAAGRWLLTASSPHPSVPEPIITQPPSHMAKTGTALDDVAEASRCPAGNPIKYLRRRPEWVRVRVVGS